MGGVLPSPAASMHFCGVSSPIAASPEGRTSVPSTNTVCGKPSMKGLPPRVFPMSASFPFWIWEEAAKASRLSASQTSAAIPTHLRARRHGGRSFGALGGFGLSSSPGAPGPLALSRSRSLARSGDRSRLRRPGRER